MLYLVIAEIAISIIHLIFCFLGNETLRKCTKLLVFIPLILILHTLDPENCLILTGLIFGIIGDFFLSFSKNKKFLVPGGIAFIFEHCILIYLLASRVSSSTPKFFIILLILIALIVFICMNTMKKTFKEFMIPISCYACLLTVELLLAVLLVIYNAGPRALLLLSGSICFITSDTLLALKLFHRPIPKMEFCLMLPYIMAQIMLCVGLTIL